MCRLINGCLLLYLGILRHGTFAFSMSIRAQSKSYQIFSYIQLLTQRCQYNESTLDTIMHFTIKKNTLSLQQGSISSQFKTAGR